MSRQLRIFLSSPGDVKAAREIAALTIERLAQDYARFFHIEPYLWEYEAMVASGHFQDTIETPSNFDIVVLILWSRLGTLLPERTTLREYRGIDGRVPVTGTEWEFEEALQAAKKDGAPDLLVYRSLKPASFDLADARLREQQLHQLGALDFFWSRHFVNQGVFRGAYAEFASEAEFAAAFESHLRKLIEKRIASGSGSDRSARVWMQAPFRGLEAYEFEHAPIFFGQDEALTRAMVQLAANAEAGLPFLLVLGASGSGKSSLVKAGIVPKLFVPRRIPGAAFLRRVVFRPSDAQENEDLFDALARRLTTQGGENEGLPELIGPGQSLSALANHLRNAGSEPAYPIGTALGLITVTARRDGRMLDYETAKLIFVVDQLEELFADEAIASDERRRFIDLLAGLARSGLVWIVATMRKDFWHRADETPELIRMSEGVGKLDLLPPSPSQLSQMIRRPAEAAGVTFEHHGTSDVPLNEVIAEEVAREPGALPLLSYLLDQLYRSDVFDSSGTTLTFGTYEKLGRLEGAIATRAEAVLDSCAPEDRQTLGSVLFSLVQMSASDGDIERAISRRVPLSTFPPDTPQRRLVEALLDAEARLLVSDAEKGRHPTVRVAHEALITRWTQARDFVQANAEALKIRRRIEERYTLWRARVAAGAHANNHNETDVKPLRARIAAWRASTGHQEGLLSEIDLIDGQRLLREHRPDTEPHLVAYIELSAADDKRIRSRSVRVLTIVATLVTLLAILASAAGLIAFQKQRQAEFQVKQTFEAQSRSLTEEAAERLKDSDVAGAQGIILEILTNPSFNQTRPPAANSLFQEARAADLQLAVLPGHGNAVTSAAFSPDGRRIVTASLDKTARVWDTASGVRLGEFSGHGDWVLSAAFSPDGERIVTASADKTARVWGVATNKQIVVLSGHGDAVTSAAFSPDGRRVVTASFDKTARIWDAATGAQLAVISGHHDIVESAAWSPDGKHIVTASNDRTARIWDAGSGALLSVLTGHGDWVLSAAFSPDGRRIVTASSDRTARVWDAASGAPLAMLSGHGDRVQKAAWSPDGRRIVTASFDKTARIWDAASGAELGVLSGHGSALESAAFSPDGQRIVTASDDKTARIWDAAGGAQLAVLSGHVNRVRKAGWSLDGRRVVTASFDRTARIWDAASGVQLGMLSGHGDWVMCAAFSPDRRRIVTASYDKTARIWDAATGVQIAVLSAGAATSAAFSPDGRRIVTTSLDRTARIWDAGSGKLLSVLSGHGDWIFSAAFSPDGRRIVTASADKTARIWNAGTGKQLGVLSGHSGTVFSAEFSPDGRRVVTASRDKIARVWDANTGAQLAAFSGHGGTVLSAAFSPDGQRIVSASADKTARVWDANTGAQLAVFSGHGGTVFSAAFSPDGNRIVTASDDRTARIWDARIATDTNEQIIWDKASEFDTLSGVERAQLGLPLDERIRTWPDNASKCDSVAGAAYDPDRQAPGVVQAEIFAEIAAAACAQELAKSGNIPRLDYQLGRSLLAEHDLAGAKHEFESAVSQGYRAAQIDLANLLMDASARMLDPVRAVSLYEKAWRDSVPIAAFELGQLYQNGVHGASNTTRIAAQPDPSKAWLWYRRGADAGEPNALARFGEHDDGAAPAARDTKKRDSILLDAFRYYAAAVERAQDEDWPDDAWKNWRYRRATLARLLAKDGMMQQVADAYTTVRTKWRPHKPSLLQRLATSLGQ